MVSLPLALGPYVNTLAAVLFGIFMVTTALLYPDDVVVDTYYKDGQGINQLRDLDEAALALNIEAKLRVGDSGSGQSHIQLTGSDEPYLQLSVFHVTDSSQDFSLRFTAQDGEFISNHDSLRSLFAEAGVWYMELRGADNDWRLRQRIVTPLTAMEF